MNEKELIKRCKRGDSLSQQILYNLYSPRMLSLCKRYVNDLDIAQDIMHDGFIKIFTKIGTYSANGIFEGWMRRVFVTTALEYLRKDQSMGRISIDCVENKIEDSNISVLSHLSENELLDCIAELPSGYRTVFNMYVIEGYSHAEIANLLNIKEKTSQSQLFRARQILQHKVESIIEQDYARRRKK